DIAGAGFDPCRPDQPGDAIIWSAANGKRRLRLTPLSGRMYGVTYSADGKRLATGGGAWQGSLSRPGEVSVWDAETGVELLSLAGRPGRAEKKEYSCSTYKTTRMVCEDIFETQIVDGKPVTVYKKVCKPVQEEHTRTNAVGVEWEEPGTVLG